VVLVEQLEQILDKMVVLVAAALIVVGVVLLEQELQVREVMVDLEMPQVILTAEAVVALVRLEQTVLLE
jgi:flagella basal body P-ring formation protein FlgA